MKRVLIVVVLIVAAAVLGVWRAHGGIRQNFSEAVGMPNNDGQGDAQDETRKSFQLPKGAKLEISDINGFVTVETSDTNTTEVYVHRTAGNKDALARREMVIEESAHGLVVRARTSHNLSFWDHLWGRNPNEEVTIKAPREIALSVKGVNGKVTTGDIDGAVEVKGINGRVQLGQVSELTGLSGINGNISLGFNQIADGGARVSGINGNIELRLGNGVNADLSAHGMNGSVRSDIPEVPVAKNDHGSGYSARIGKGGASISLSGINGNVRLTRAEAQTTSTAASASASTSSKESPAKK